MIEGPPEGAREAWVEALPVDEPHTRDLVAAALEGLRLVPPDDRWAAAFEAALRDHADRQSRPVTASTVRELAADRLTEALRDLSVEITEKLAAAVRHRLRWIEPGEAVSLASDALYCHVHRKIEEYRRGRDDARGPETRLFPIEKSFWGWMKQWARAAVRDHVRRERTGRGLPPGPDRDPGAGPEPVPQHVGRVVRQSEEEQDPPRSRPPELEGQRRLEAEARQEHLEALIARAREVLGDDRCRSPRLRAMREGAREDAWGRVAAAALEVLNRLEQAVQGEQFVEGEQSVQGGRVWAPDPRALARLSYGAVMHDLPDNRRDQQARRAEADVLHAVITSLRIAVGRTAVPGTHAAMAGEDVAERFHLHALRCALFESVAARVKGGRNDGGMEVLGGWAERVARTCQEAASAGSGDAATLREAAERVLEDLTKPGAQHPSALEQALRLRRTARAGNQRVWAETVLRVHWLAAALSEKVERHD